MRGNHRRLCVLLFVIAVLVFMHDVQAEPGTRQRTQAPGPQREASGPGARPEKRGAGPEKRSSAIQRAAALVAAGNRYLRSGQYPEAIAAYRQAIRYHYEPGYEYNLALAYYKHDELASAYGHFASALLGEGTPLARVKRERASEYVEMLRDQLGEIEITCRERGVTVMVDDRLVSLDEQGRGRAMADAGEVRVVASKPGHMTFRGVLQIDAGQVKSQEIRLEKMKDGPGSMEALQRELRQVRGHRDGLLRVVREPGEGRSRGGGKRSIGVALMIAGGVAAGTGMGYGLMASRANRRAQRLVELGVWQPPVSDVVNEIGEGADAGLIAGTVAGAGLFGAGAVLYWLGRRDARSAVREAETRFSVVPYVDETLIGVQVRGGF